jgi:hypothetical protein
LQLTPQDEQSWNKAYQAFVQHSVLDQNFNFEKEFATLRHAYNVHLKADVRFVPYAMVAQEPPCAGVDYRPGKAPILPPIAAPIAVQRSADEPVGHSAPKPRVEKVPQPPQTIEYHKGKIEIQKVRPALPNDAGPQSRRPLE